MNHEIFSLTRADFAELASYTSENFNSCRCASLTPPDSPEQAELQSARVNDVDLYKIEKGLDKRCTCMIRNIPNKYTQQMLLDFVNETHRGKFDFFYLRMDFKNKCNVGYAFINFLDPM